MTTDPLLVETASRAFADTCDHGALQAAARDGWAPRVWDAAASIGLPWVGVPEAVGGVGGTLADAIEVVRCAGAHGAPVPLAETGVLAGWLLAGAGLPVSGGPLTVVPDPSGLRFEDGAISGAAHRVAWGRAVEDVVVLVDGRVARVPTRGLAIEQAANLAGEPRDTLVFERAVPSAIADAADGVTADALRFRGALSRVALMAGALETLATRTAEYTRERHQFGKPIAGFQLVQAMVVRAAEEAVLVDVALQAATVAAGDGLGAVEIAAAKALAGSAARTATRAAHQAHGAIGMTQEHGLHHLTRRLWSWRAEYGDSSWSRRLGRAVLAAGADQLYEVVADGSRALPAL